MADRVVVQVRFKKALWTCPRCGQEDWQDRSMTGGDSYVHTCSACSFEFNQSCGGMKVFESMLSYAPEDFEKKTEEDIATEKQALADGWLNEVKNPPTAVEPTKEDLQSLYEQKLAEANKQLEALSEKLTSEELAVVKASVEAKTAEVVAQVDSKIAEKVALEAVEAPIEKEPIEEIKG